MTRWIFVSDLHLGLTPGYREERRRLLIERVAAERPHFVIHGGDHIAGKVNDDPEERRNVESMWAAYHRVMAPSKEAVSGDIDHRQSRPDRIHALRPAR